jgi:hypothetical protein
MSDNKGTQGKKAVGQKTGNTYANKIKAPARVAQPKFTGDCDDLAEVIFDCQDSQQSGKFAATLDKLANYVGSKFRHGGDIRRVVKDIATVSLIAPAYPPDTATKGETKLWEIELSNFVKRRVELDDNMQKLYALVWGQCNPHMKSKLEAVDTFEVFDDLQDPVALLKKIKGMTYRFDGGDYLPHAIADATVRFSRLFQGKDMTNSQYLERFKSMVAVIDHYGGSVGSHPRLIQDEIARITG